MFAMAGRRAADRDRRVRQGDAAIDQLDRAELRVRHFAYHVEVLDLRVGQGFVKCIDRRRAARS